MEAIIRELNSALRRHKVVRLGLRGNVGSAPFGVPVALSAELAVLQLLRDFRPDGWSASVLPRIEEVRYTAFERSYTRVCSAEGVLTKVIPPARVEFTSLIDLLVSLRRRGGPILVNHALPENDSVTTLGTIHGVTETAIELRPFDATGRWLPRGAIGLGDVLDVQWGSRYLRVWGRYLGL